MSRFLVVTAGEFYPFHPSLNRVDKQVPLRAHCGALMGPNTSQSQVWLLQFVVLRPSNDRQLGQLSSELPVLLGH